MRIAVVTPTINTRRTTRPLTLWQWRALGLDPILAHQPTDLPMGHTSQGTTARTALRMGLDTGADTIVFAEDDIDIDPRIPLDIPPGVVVSYWSRPRFRPDGDDLWAPARDRRRWWGAQCFACDRDTARSIVDSPVPGGVDMVLRHIDAPLLVTTRPMVEHRDLPRAATRSTVHFTSDGDYQGPDSHTLATRLREWLPGRRDRRRVAAPSVAEANGIATAYELQWLFPAMEEMGHIIRDKRSADTWHRGIPLPWDQATKPASAPKEGGLW